MTDHSFLTADWNDMDNFDDFLVDFADDVSISGSEGSGNSYEAVHSELRTYDRQDAQFFALLGQHLPVGATRHSSAKKPRSQKVAKTTKDSKAICKTQKAIKRSTSIIDTVSVCSDPRKSLQNVGMKLMIFPSFEKCNSLEHFPQTMTLHLNTGDHDSLSRLMHTYVDKSCEVHFCNDGQSAWNYQRLLQLFHFTSDLHPDGIMCVHTAKIVEHDITATIYFKFTDNLLIRESVIRNTRDPEFSRMTVGRGEKLKQSLRLDDRPEDERRELCILADSDHDVIVYGKLDLKISIDSHSKKIVRLVFESELTSLVPCAPIRNDTLAE
jgi:hypothetical protein